MDTHTENSIRAAIVNSLRGPARELVGFIGYLADINLILSEVSNQFGKKCSRDKLQQEFYQMCQDKGEKIRVFVSHLEQIYRRLKETFPGRFNEAQLKDRLFHGMMQGLCDSMMFLYKDPRVNYQFLLEATEEAEEEVRETRVRAKAASIENDGIKDLKDRIETLTPVMKSGTYQNGGPKLNQPQKPTTPNKFQKKYRENGQGSPKKSNGPAMTSVRPFKPGQKLYQCYKCGGRGGHNFRNCPTPENIDWRSLSGAEIPLETKTSGPANKTQDQQ